MPTSVYTTDSASTLRFMDMSFGSYQVSFNNSNIINNNNSPYYVLDDDFMLKHEKPDRFFTCFFCTLNFDSRQTLQQHQEICGFRPSGLEFLPFSPPEERSRVEKRAFLECFNLVTIGKCEVLSRAKENVVCDVILIDDSDDQSDSFETSSESSTLLSTIYNKNGELSVSARKNATKLLEIDLGSPLGLRLQRHIGTIFGQCEPNASIINDPVELEWLCRGRIPQPTYYQITGSRWRCDANERYQVTFHRSRVQKYSHMFRCTRRQRREFCRTYDTGLCARARRLKRLMKPVSVRLTRMSMKLQRYVNGGGDDMPVLENVHEQGEEYSSFLSTDTIETRPPSTSELRYGVTADCGRDVSKSVALRTKSGLRISFRRAGSSEDSRWQIVKKTVTHGSLMRRAAISSPNDSVMYRSTTAASSSTAAADASACTERVYAISGDSENDGGAVVHCDSVSQMQHRDHSLSTETVSSKSVITLMTGQELMNTWKAGMSLPPLSFRCEICHKVMACDIQSKTIIYSHYATHGITNISLVTTMLEDGEIEIKLLEISQDSLTPSVPNQATDVQSANKPAQLGRHRPCFAESSEKSGSKVAVDGVMPSPYSPPSTKDNSLVPMHPTNTSIAAAEDNQSMTKLATNGSTEETVGQQHSSGTLKYHTVPHGPSSSVAAGFNWVAPPKPEVRQAASTIQPAIIPLQSASSVSNVHCTAAPVSTNDFIDIDDIDAARETVSNAVSASVPSLLQSSTSPGQFGHQFRENTFAIPQHSGHVVAAQQQFGWPTTAAGSCFNGSSAVRWNSAPPPVNAWMSTPAIQHTAAVLADAFVQSGMAGYVQTMLQQMMNNSYKNAAPTTLQPTSQPATGTSNDVIYID